MEQARPNRRRGHHPGEVGLLVLRQRVRGATGHRVRLDPPSPSNPRIPSKARNQPLGRGVAIKIMDRPHRQPAAAAAPADLPCHESPTRRDFRRGTDAGSMKRHGRRGSVRCRSLRAISTVNEMATVMTSLGITLLARFPKTRSTLPIVRS